MVQFTIFKLYDGVKVTVFTSLWILLQSLILIFFWARGMWSDTLPWCWARAEIHSSQWDPRSRRWTADTLRTILYPDSLSASHFQYSIPEITRDTQHFIRKQTFHYMVLLSCYKCLSMCKFSWAKRRWSVVSVYSMHLQLQYFQCMMGFSGYKPILSQGRPAVKTERRQ